MTSSIRQVTTRIRSNIGAPFSRSWFDSATLFVKTEKIWTVRNPFYVVVKEHDCEGPSFEGAAQTPEAASAWVKRASEDEAKFMRDIGMKYRTRRSTAQGCDKVKIVVGDKECDDTLTIGFHVKCLSIS